MTKLILLGHDLNFHSNLQKVNVSYLTLTRNLITKYILKQTSCRFVSITRYEKLFFQKSIKKGMISLTRELTFLVVPSKGLATLITILKIYYL